MGLEQKLGNMGVVTMTLEQAVNWGRTNAMWPMLFGLACGAIEMISTVAGPQNDLAVDALDGGALAIEIFVGVTLAV